MMRNTTGYMLDALGFDSSPKRPKFSANFQFFLSESTACFLLLNGLQNHSNLA